MAAYHAQLGAWLQLSLFLAVFSVLNTRLLSQQVCQYLFASLLASLKSHGLSASQHAE